MTLPLSGRDLRPEQDQAAATFLLSASEIRRLVTITDVIEAVDQAARERAAGRLTAAPRVATPGGTLLMAAESAERDGVAAKIVSIAAGNRAAGLATIQGLALWLDYSTRRPVLVADAPTVTALRTGALAAVATRALAHPDASVLAMIGTGGQALAQVEAVAAVRPVRDVRVASLHRESAEEFCRRLAGVLPGVQARACDSVTAAVRDAEIVCLATTARTALVEQHDLPADVHVNAVGAYRPDMRELAVSVFEAARLVCSDDPEGAFGEAGDLMDAIAAGVLDPGAVIELGALDGALLRSLGTGLTVFKSVGTAAADLALLDLLVRRATKSAGTRSFGFGE
jgi:ornithine cyclodeaminase